MPVKQVTPNTVPDLPADFKALGVTRGFDPKPVSQLKILIQGRPGCGKSTFCNSSPRTLVLDFDDGSDSIAAPRAHRMTILAFKDLAAVHAKLLEYAKAGKRPFDRVVFDSGDAFQTVVEHQLCEDLSDGKRPIEFIGDYGSEGAGYNKLYKRCMTFLQELYAVGYGWTVAGHVGEKEIKRRGPNGKMTTETVWRPLMNKGFVTKVAKEAHYIFTAYSITQSETLKEKRNVPGQGLVEVDAGTRRVTRYGLRCQGGGDEKQRVAVPDDMIVPDVDGWAVFENAYRDGVEAARAKEAQNQEVEA